MNVYLPQSCNGSAFQLCSSTLSASTDTVTNVRFEQTPDDKVVIEYDLVSDSPSARFRIGVEVSRNAGLSYDLIPESVSGDAGAYIGPGSVRRIVWNVREDFETLKLDEAVIRVWAERIATSMMISGVHFEFVGIPVGSFSMGSNDGDRDERPVHQVTISRGFQMGTYEVTQEQWQAVMGSNPSGFKDCARCPVEKVSWTYVQEFMGKLNANGGLYL